MTMTEAYESPRPVVTLQIQMRSDETLPQFIERLRKENLWRPGDTVVFLNQQGRLDTVRISRPAW